VRQHRAAGMKPADIATNRGISVRFPRACERHRRDAQSGDLKHPETKCFGLLAIFLQPPTMERRFGKVFR
jgi:hypothetical protein